MRHTSVEQCGGHPCTCEVCREEPCLCENSQDIPDVHTYSQEPTKERVTVAFRGWKQNPRSDGVGVGVVRQTKPKSCLLIFMDPQVSIVAKTPLEYSNTLRGSEADVYNLRQVEDPRH